MCAQREDIHTRHAFKREVPLAVCPNASRLSTTAEGPHQFIARTCRGIGPVIMGRTVLVGAMQSVDAAWQTLTVSSGSLPALRGKLSERFSHMACIDPNIYRSVSPRHLQSRHYGRVCSALRA